MVDACINTLYEIAQDNEKVVVMGSDSMNIGEIFKEKIPRQYIEMGIAESNLAGAAAGMSTCGFIPFVYAVAPFLVYRALEFIRDDICLQKRNVKIIAYSAGMDYCTSGPTHHTTEDIAMLRAIPNLTILSPGSVREVKEMVKAAAQIEGPVYIRLARERGREFQSEDYKFEQGVPCILKDGTDVIAFTSGSITYDVLKAADKAQESGVSVKVVHLGTIKPLKTDSILNEIKYITNVITVEENVINGGIGGLISEFVVQAGLGCRIKRIGINDSFALGYGNHDEIKEMNGMGIDEIANKMCSFH